MKKITLFIIASLITAAVFAQNIYKLDLNNFPARNGDNTATFDKATKTVAFKTQDRNIYLDLNNLNISDYNIVRIKYKTADYGFIFGTNYGDDSMDWTELQTYCPSYLSEMVIPLKNGQKKLKGIFVQSGWNVPHAQFVLESVTLEKVADPKLTDIRANPENVPPVIDTATTETIDKTLDAWDFVSQFGVGFQYDVFASDDLAPIIFGVDCHLSWAMPNPSKEIVQFIKNKGFKTLRLQTSPGAGHILDENYTIDPNYIKAVKQVVDWAIEEGMYVILCGQWNDCMSEQDWIDAINESVHFAGYTVNKKDKKQSQAFIKAMWKQYAEAFNNSYDEHLIFETLNEPTDRLHEHTFWERTDCSVCKEDFAIFNEYNQLIVDTIRSTGGNNANRFIMIEGLGARWQNITTNLFKMPKDKAKNKLIAALHNYPMGAPPSYQNFYTKGVREYSITECFEALDKYFFKKKIPVYISETGVSTFTPIMERIRCMKDFMAEVTKNGRSCAITMHCTQGNSDFDYYNSFSLKWFDTEYVDTLLFAAECKEFSLSEDFIKNNEVTFESIVGKNLLEEPLDIKNWGNDFKLSPDLFFRTTPAKYKLVFQIEKPASDSILRIAYEDMKGDWHEFPNVNGVKSKGAEVKDGWCYSVKANTVELSINEKLSESLSDYARAIWIGGQNIIIKSVKVME